MVEIGKRKCLNEERIVLRINSQVPSAYHAMCGKQRETKEKFREKLCSAKSTLCMRRRPRNKMGITKDMYDT